MQFSGTFRIACARNCEAAHEESRECANKSALLLSAGARGTIFKGLHPQRPTSIII